MTAVSIKVPESMIEYTTDENDKVAQILGIHKMDLIALYGALEILYFNQTKAELESDVFCLCKRCWQFAPQ